MVDLQPELGQQRGFDVSYDLFGADGVVADDVDLVYAAVAVGDDLERADPLQPESRPSTSLSPQGSSPRTSAPSSSGLICVSFLARGGIGSDSALHSRYVKRSVPFRKNGPRACGRPGLAGAMAVPSPRRGLSVQIRQLESRRALAC